MRQLPKYAFLSGEGILGQKVIMLQHPYLIANVYDVNRHKEDEVEAFMEDMIQERYPIAKVKGYTIFLTPYSSLEPNNNKEFQTAVLKEMAEYFLENRVLKKPGLFRMSDESGRSEKKFDPSIQKERRLRSRKNRDNE